MEKPKTLAAQLRRDEGMRNFPYHCSGGFLTIGIGRNLNAVGISDEEAEILLANDISAHRTALLTNYPWAFELDDVRAEAMINLHFNIGAGGVAKFKKFLAAMKAGEWETAAAELLDSRYAKQVGARAQRLAEQIITGERQ